jgi:hypothetical protein
MTMDNRLSLRASGAGWAGGGVAGPFGASSKAGNSSRTFGLFSEFARGVK